MPIADSRFPIPDSRSAGLRQKEMSIILGPYDSAAGGGSTEQREGEDCEELFVFGYACKLFRDDDKCLLESSGQMLIPWMGDGSLMVDR